MRGDRPPHALLGAALLAALLRQLDAARDHHDGGAERLPALPRAQPGRPRGVVDPQAGPAHPHRRHPHVHQRPALPVAALGRHRRVDPQGQLAAGARLGRVRVPGQHRAQDQPGVPAQRGRVQGEDPGQPGALHQERQRHQPDVRGAADARPAVLHLLVPRRARGQLLAARRHQRGHREADPHVAPAHLARAAAGLGQLHVRAVQLRLGQRRRARAQRRTPRGHAARQQQQWRRHAPVVGTDLPAVSRDVTVVTRGGEVINADTRDWKFRLLSYTVA
ncbi:uncharacterized protein LOC134536927 isoform X4 [Bacillus rossius redtenbacheri]|uniref:uncharacterized protein LOC134536927 isoform X4 n=1 Tax=Bacillus rossius redtenbacheri TaxID=93214 RepID=UPI002FDC9E5A